MVQSLDGPNLRGGVGAPEFAAVLDLSELGGIEADVDADTIVTAYVDSIAAGNYSLSAHRIGAAGATALARMASRTEALRAKFLHPLDVRARLAAAPQDNELITADSVGRSLRTYIRILSPQCHWWSVRRCLPRILSDALNDPLFGLGASAATKRRGASSVRPGGSKNPLGSSVSIDRPLAADLAAALAFVDQPRQHILLVTILETDEPLMLAQLLSRSRASSPVSTLKNAPRIAHACAKKMLRRNPLSSGNAG